MQANKAQKWPHAHTHVHCSYFYVCVMKFNFSLFSFFGFLRIINIFSSYACRCCWFCCHSFAFIRSSMWVWVCVCVCQQLNKLMPYERGGRGGGRRCRVVARTQSQGQFSHYTCLAQKASAEIRTITACVCVTKSECVTVCVCNCVCVPF